MSEWNHLYADSGLIGPKNPCPHGITWAYITVSSVGPEERGGPSDSGVLMATDVGTPDVSNNVGEFYAILRGMMVLPDGWAGTIQSDSNVALCTLVSRNARPWLPPMIVEHMEQQKARLGKFTTRLLGGHPTRADMAAGFTKKRGLPCSVWQVWCDETCQARGAETRKALNIGE